MTRAPINIKRAVAAAAATVILAIPVVWWTTRIAAAESRLSVDSFGLGFSLVGAIAVVILDWRHTTTRAPLGAALLVTLVNVALMRASFRSDDLVMADYLTPADTWPWTCQFEVVAGSEGTPTRDSFCRYRCRNQATGATRKIASSAIGGKGGRGQPNNARDCLHPMAVAGNLRIEGDGGAAKDAK